MKKTVFTLLVVCLGLQAFAQQNNDDARQNGKKPPRKETEKHKIIRPLLCPSFYITTSTGLNNNTGLLGFSFDFPIAKYFSLEGGAGESTWGYKVSVSGKYYLQPCQRGWAFGAGITYNTGAQNYQSSLATVTGQTETVGLDLHPQTNLFFAAYHYWNLGRKYNRFYLELGWSVPLSGNDRFDQVSGDQITSTSVSVMNLLSPGGLIVGTGFSFGIR